MKTLDCKILLTCLIVSFGVVSCGNRPDEIVSPEAEHREQIGHVHAPQNGGVPIVIGNEEFHLELVHTPGESLMSAYVLDGHMEDYVRLSQVSFDVNIKMPVSERRLVFHAVADRATGETVGDTALFQAEAGWLKDMTNFDGAIPSIEIRSKRFENVEFNYPEGNESVREGRN